MKIDNFHSLKHALSCIPAILNCFFLWVLLYLDRYSSDSSDKEYSSENIMSSSTFNSQNIDSTILWRLYVISELDLNPGLKTISFVILSCIFHANQYIWIYTAISLPSLIYYLFFWSISLSDYFCLPFKVKV